MHDGSQGLSPSPEKYQGTVLSWFSVRQLISLSKRDFCSNTFIFRLFASAPVTVAPARPENFSGFEGHFGRFHLFCGAVAETLQMHKTTRECETPAKGHSRFSRLRAAPSISLHSGRPQIPLLTRAHASHPTAARLRLPVPATRPLPAGARTRRACTET